jgi:hypothetical protein
MIWDDQARYDDRDQSLPEWLWAELIALAEAFAHLPAHARYGALSRNLSPRAHDYFDQQAARRVHELGEGEGRL